MGPTVMGFWGTKGYPLAGTKKFYCSGGSSYYYIYYDGEFTWFDVHLNKLKSGKFHEFQVSLGNVEWITFLHMFWRKSERVIKLSSKMIFFLINPWRNCLLVRMCNKVTHSWMVLVKYSEQPIISTCCA